MKCLLAVYVSSLLFCSVSMLNCISYKGNSETCSPTFSKQCPPGNLCAAVFYNCTMPEFTVNVLDESHGCLTRAICNQENSSTLKTTYSANFGMATAFLHIACCESDDCNCITVPEQDNKPNGFQCLSCRRLTDPACNASISCVGNQDHCITGTVLNMANLTIKGCASKSFCEANFYNSTLTDIRCCSGNLCNGSQVRSRQDVQVQVQVGLLLMSLLATKLL